MTTTISSIERAALPDASGNCPLCPRLKAFREDLVQRALAAAMTDASLRADQCSA
jgi:hypothetical protein